jgi:hypothetical protein
MYIAGPLVTSSRAPAARQLLGSLPILVHAGAIGRWQHSGTSARRHRPRHREAHARPQPTVLLGRQRAARNAVRHLSPSRARRPADPSSQFDPPAGSELSAAPSPQCGRATRRERPRRNAARRLGRSVVLGVWPFGEVAWGGVRDGLEWSRGVAWSGVGSVQGSWYWGFSCERTTNFRVSWRCPGRRVALTGGEIS